MKDFMMRKVLYCFFWFVIFSLFLFFLGGLAIGVFAVVQNPEGKLAEIRGEAWSSAQTFGKAYAFYIGGGAFFFAFLSTLFGWLPGTKKKHSQDNKEKVETSIPDRGEEKRDPSREVGMMEQSLPKEKTRTPSPFLSPQEKKREPSNQPSPPSLKPKTQSLSPKGAARTPSPFFVPEPKKEVLEEDSQEEISEVEKAKRLSDRYLNPFFSLWTKPRATMQQVLLNQPNLNRVFMYTALGAFSNILMGAFSSGLGEKMSLIKILLLLGGVSLGQALIYLIFFAPLTRWVGNLMGGQVNSSDIRIVFGYASIPFIWLLILWVPLVSFFGREIFSADLYNFEQQMRENPFFVLLMAVYGGITAIVSFWSMVIFLKCLGQACGFSAWRALLTVFLSGLIMGIGLLLLAVAVWLGMMAFSKAGIR